MGERDYRLSERDTQEEFGLGFVGREVDAVADAEVDWVGELQPEGLGRELDASGRLSYGRDRRR